MEISRGPIRTTQRSEQLPFGRWIRCNGNDSIEEAISQMAKPRASAARLPQLAQAKELPPRPEPGPLVATFAGVRRYHRRSDGKIIEVAPRARGWYTRELSEVPHYAKGVSE